MRFGETIVVYLIIGAGISIALLVRNTDKGRIQRIYLAAVGVIFWPVFLPMLVGKRPAEDAPIVFEAAIESGVFLHRISGIEGELNRLLGNKDGWAERVLASEADRIRSLIAAMRSQANRVNEMEHLLSDLNGRPSTPVIGNDDSHGNKNQIGRRDNIDFLAKLHDNAERDLWQTINKTEELISMVYVARFAGGSRSEVDHLLSAISSTVESISAVAEQQSS